MTFPSVSWFSQKDKRAWITRIPGIGTHASGNVCPQPGTMAGASCLEKIQFLLHRITPKHEFQRICYIEFIREILVFKFRSNSRAFSRACFFVSVKFEWELQSGCNRNSYKQQRYITGQFRACIVSTKPVDPLARIQAIYAALKPVNGKETFLRTRASHITLRIYIRYEIKKRTIRTRHN